MEAIRKILFWLLRDDQSKLFNVTRILLRFLGIWAEEGSILAMRITCTLSLSAYTAIGTISFLYHNDDDITSYGIELCMSIIGFLSMIKTLWFFYSSEKIGWLIKELERITVENMTKEESQRPELLEAVSFTKRLTILPLIMLWLEIITETLHCLFFTNNDSRMMFNLYSFIDPTRYYFLALAFQYVFLMWAITIFVISFNMLICFTMLSVANLSVLERYLSSAPSNLSRSVNLHADIMRFVKVMNEVLRPAIICELTMGSVITCVSAYMCVESITLHQKLFSYSAFCCTLVVPWFICHCGSILEEKSAKLTDAVYSSRWIELKPKQRKEIIILMIATSRPLQIKLCSTHIINYEYYTSFIQMSYSFFTLLLSVNSN